VKETNEYTTKARELEKTKPRRQKERKKRVRLSYILVKKIKIKNPKAKNSCIYGCNEAFSIVEKVV